LIFEKKYMSDPTTPFKRRSGKQLAHTAQQGYTVLLSWGSQHQLLVAGYTGGLCCDSTGLLTRHPATFVSLSLFIPLSLSFAAVS
jgi:hypothetical protein